MATAADAATEAASAPVETAEVSGQVDQKSPETTETTAEGAPAAKGKVSEVVRLAREKRVLERRLAEATAVKPKADDAPTRESILAGLKKQYEEDPEALLEAVAGEDFVTLAKRIAKREETAKSPANKIEALEKQLADLQKQLDGERSTKASADAKATAEQHVATVQKEIETSVDDDGAPRYPTLVSLDPEALEEPVALTAYKAVERAHAKECREGGKPEGKIVKQWTPEQQTARFHAAFAGLEAHYAKLRTPKTPNTPKAEEPEPSPTISNKTSSGHVDPPARRASGTLSVQEALRLALKEHGLSH